MSDWFATAKQSFTRDRGAASPAVPFERVCLCGAPLTGERTDAPQTIYCGACGRDWFVLPADPYPKRKSREKLARRAGRLSSSWPRIPRLPRKPKDQSAATPPDAIRAASTRKPAARATVEPDEEVTAPKPETEQTAGQIRLPPTWRERLRARARRAAGTVRLVIVGVIVPIIGTGLWLGYQARLDAAAARLVEAVPAAEDAIDQSQWSTALEQMSAASEALDILARDDPAAIRIRQRHRELVAMTSLAPLTPFDLADEAGSYTNQPESWARRFDSTCAGQWVIFDVYVGEARPATTSRKPHASDGDSAQQDSDSGQAPPVERVVPLELPATAGDVPVRWELAASEIAEPAIGRRAILALQYESWTMMQTETGAPAWVVRFQPGSVLLWTSADLYQGVGFNIDDPLFPARDLLARQAKRLGVEYPTEPNTNPPAAKEET